MFDTSKKNKTNRNKHEGRLNFCFHVDTLIKESSKKCHCLARVNNYMDSNGRCAVMNAFIKFQFSYCPSRMDVK